MKDCLRKLAQITVVGSAALLAGTTSLPAQDNNSGTYWGTDLGLNWAGDLTVPQGSISLSPGARWDVSMGYAFKLPCQFTFGPEVETGVIYNPLDQVSSGGQTASSGGGYVQVPLMGDGVLKCRIVPHLIAYAGGGAGYDFNSLNITSVGGIDTDEIGSEFDFAWQAMAGIRYQFDSCELGVGYQYLAVKPSGLQTVGNSTIAASLTVYF